MRADELSALDARATVGQFQVHALIEGQRRGVGLSHEADRQRDARGIHRHDGHLLPVVGRLIERDGLERHADHDVLRVLEGHELLGLLCPAVEHLFDSELGRHQCEAGQRLHARAPEGGAFDGRDGSGEHQLGEVIHLLRISLLIPVGGQFRGCRAAVVSEEHVGEVVATVDDVEVAANVACTDVAQHLVAVFTIVEVVGIAVAVVAVVHDEGARLGIPSVGAGLVVGRGGHVLADDLQVDVAVGHDVVGVVAAVAPLHHLSAIVAEGHLLAVLHQLPEEVAAVGALPLALDVDDGSGGQRHVEVGGVALQFIIVTVDAIGDEGVHHVLRLEGYSQPVLCCGLCRGRQCHQAEQAYIE